MPNSHLWNDRRNSKTECNTKPPSSRHTACSFSSLLLFWYRHTHSYLNSMQLQITPQMRNVFSLADYKKPKQIKAVLVAVISGLQFTSLQNFTTIMSLFTCTFCWWTQKKRKSTGQIKGMKLPIELETHKKEIIRKDTWAYDLTKSFSLHFPNSTKPAGTPIGSLAELATLGCHWGCQPLAQEPQHSTAWLERTTKHMWPSALLRPWEQFWCYSSNLILKAEQWSSAYSLQEAYLAIGKSQAWAIYRLPAAHGWSVH